MTSTGDLPSNFSEIQSESGESKCDDSDIFKTRQENDIADQYIESGSNDEYSPRVSPSSSFSNDEKVKEGSTIITKQPKYERKLLRQMHSVGLSDIAGYYSDDSAVRRKENNGEILDLYFNKVPSKKGQMNENDVSPTREYKDEKTKRGHLFLKKSLSSKTYKSEKSSFDGASEKSFFQSLRDKGDSAPSSSTENEQDDNVIRRTYSFLKKRNASLTGNECTRKNRSTRKSLKQRNSSLPTNPNDGNIVKGRISRKLSKKRDYSIPAELNEIANKDKSSSGSFRLRRQRSSVCEAILSKNTTKCGDNKNKIDVISNTEGASPVSISTSSISLYSGTAAETEKKHFETTIFDNNQEVQTDYEDFRPESPNSSDELKTRKRKQKRRVSTKKLTAPVNCLSSGDESPISKSLSPMQYVKLMKSLSRSLTTSKSKENLSGNPFKNDVCQLNENKNIGCVSLEACNQNVKHNSTSTVINTSPKNKENSENPSSPFESNSEEKKSLISSLRNNCSGSSVLYQLITSQTPGLPNRPTITGKPSYNADNSSDAANTPPDNADKPSENNIDDINSAKQEDGLKQNKYMNGGIEGKSGNKDVGDKQEMNKDNDETMRYERRKSNALKRFQLTELKSRLTMDLKSYLCDKHYQSDKVSIWCQDLSESIKEKVVEVTDGDYKVVTQVFIGALVDKGIHLATEARHNGAKDGFFAVCYRGTDIFAVASILAFDLN